MSPVITIITINYNNVIGLHNTIVSVTNQEYAQIEYIIIDGGSTDGSIDSIVENVDKVSYWISEQDKGVYDAMNKGIAKATGEYIIFLNSGDLFIDNQVVSKCCDHLYLDKQVGVDILYGNIFVVNQENKKDHIHFHPEKLTLGFFRKDTINHQASLIKKSLFDEFGLYPDNFRLASDYWLYLLSFLKEKTYKYLNAILITYDFTGMSAVDEFKEYKEEQKQIWQKLVPNHVQEILYENDSLKLEIDRYKHLLNYKLVNAAVNVNDSIQKIRRKKNRFIQPFSI